MDLVGYKKLTLNELQSLQLEAMKELHSACANADVKYYLIAGSLLGAIRHGGFIPWDDDIDIAMMREDYERFKQMFPGLMDANKYFLQHYGTDEDFRPALMRLCIKGTYLDVPCEAHWHYCKNTYIDIFPIDNVPDSEWKTKAQERELKVLDKLIRAKLFRIHATNSKIVVLIKKIRAFLLSVIPLKLVQSLTEKVMKRYDENQTERVCSMASHYSYKRQTMPRCYYGNPVLIKFEDTFFYSPEMPHEYLSHLYGINYMDVPPVEKRDSPSDVYVKMD